MQNKPNQNGLLSAFPFILFFFAKPNLLLKLSMLIQYKDSVLVTLNYATITIPKSQLFITTNVYSPLTFMSIGGQLWFFCVGPRLKEETPSETFLVSYQNKRSKGGTTH